MARSVSEFVSVVDDAMRSQQIGKEHEDRVEALLREIDVDHVRSKRVRTTHGIELLLDFWLSSTPNRPSVVLECKNFGVETKSKSGSRKRKVQEALWLLIQVRRYCPETKEARIVLVTGREPFLDEQRQLIKDEFGPDFYIVSIEDQGKLKGLVE